MKLKKKLLIHRSGRSVAVCLYIYIIYLYIHRHSRYNYPKKKPLSPSPGNRELEKESACRSRLRRRALLPRCPKAFWYLFHFDSVVRHVGVYPPPPPCAFIIYIFIFYTCVCAWSYRTHINYIRLVYNISSADFHDSRNDK